MDTMRLATACSCYHMFITMVDGISSNCEPNCHLHSSAAFCRSQQWKKVIVTVQCTSKSSDWQCRKEKKCMALICILQNGAVALDFPSVAAGEVQGPELLGRHTESSELPCLPWNTDHRTLNHPAAELIHAIRTDWDISHYQDLEDPSLQPVTLSQKLAWPGLLFFTSAFLSGL